MKIVIAPDSFKESLAASEVAATIAAAFQSVHPSWSVHPIPMADGGEGTLDVLIEATKGKYFVSKVTGPLGQSLDARWGVLGNSKTAIIEMATAAGLADVPPELRNPLNTTSYGVGELILNALGEGCDRCMLTFGGSATVDGGVGMLQALGVEVVDRSGQRAPPGGKALAQIAKVNTDPLNPLREHCQFIGLCDVENPLLGLNGAAPVFAPQKGASPAMVLELEEGLENWAQFAARELAIAPRSGAAGGLSYALSTYLGAPLLSGFDVIADTLNLRSQMEGADLVITGEGQINFQSAHGKVPSGVARIAKELNIPVIAIAGQLGKGFEEIFSCGVDAAFSISPGPVSLQNCLQKAKDYLFRSSQEIAKTLNIGRML